MAVLPAVAWGLGLAEKTTVGNGLLTQSLTADGDNGAKDKDPTWIWNADFQYVRQESPNPDGGAPIVDETNDYTVGGGWSGPSGVSVDMSLLLSNTPAENLVSRGVTFSPAYHWYYRGRPAPDDDEYKPYLDIKLNTGQIDFVESFQGFTRITRKITIPVQGIDQLWQSQLGLELSWKPVHDWRFGLAADHYGYNRDVAQFEQLLTSNRALNAGMGGFTDTVGSLPSETYTASIDWAFAEKWKNKFVEALSTEADDGSIATETKDTVEYKPVSRCKIAVGAAWDKSNIENIFSAILGLRWETD